MVDGTALWFGAAGFDVLDIVDDGVELVIDVETTKGVAGCSSCGAAARPKDRRWVTLRDVPAGRRFVRVRWRKRIWRCAGPDYEVNAWTEQAGLAGPRRVLTTRAPEWATDRAEAIEGTPASIARSFGLSWSTVWSAVERIGRQRLLTPAEAGPADIVRFDETVMSPASRRRRRRFVTAVVDVGAGRLLDRGAAEDQLDVEAVALSEADPRVDDTAHETISAPSPVCPAPAFRRCERQGRSTRRAAPPSGLTGPSGGVPAKLSRSDISCCFVPRSGIGRKGESERRRLGDIGCFTPFWHHVHCQRDVVSASKQRGDMPKARVSEKAEMRAPEGPPPTEGIAYSGEESEMPTGAMAESGTMGPIEESTMPLAGMGEPGGMPAGTPLGAVSVSGLPGAAGDLLAAAGMVAGPPGMATGGMGMGPSAHSGAGAEAEMPSGNMAFGDDMASVAMDPPTPGFGDPATQPGVGPATGQMPGTGEPAPPPGTGTTNGQMPGGGADPTSGTATGEMPGASASPSGSPTPTPGPGPTHPIVLSGTWCLSITIAASGHAADAPS